jgi:hypothetical protein
MAKPTGKPNGRPEIFTPELALAICEQISTTSKSLKTICLDENMPSVGTILKWLNEDKEGFLGQYDRAKQNQAEFMAEEMIDIADDGSNDFMTITGKGGQEYEVENKEVTSRSRLRVDTRKWLLSKLKPKKYGDKVQQEISGANGQAFEITLKL